MLLPSETQRASVFEGMAMPMVPLVLVALLSQALTARPNNTAAATLMILCIVSSSFCCWHFSGMQLPFRLCKQSRPGWFAYRTTSNY
ncbi:hypothetical protein D3C72_2291720 [compost metagenome]